MVGQPDDGAVDRLADQDHTGSERGYRHSAATTDARHDRCRQADRRSSAPEEGAGVVPAAAIAASKAVVSSSRPLPLAPKSRTFSAPLSGGYGAACVCPQVSTDASDIASAAHSAGHVEGLRRTLDLDSVLWLPGRSSGALGQQILVVVEISVRHPFDCVRLCKCACVAGEIRQPDLAGQQPAHGGGETHRITRFEQHAGFDLTRINSGKPPIRLPITANP